MRGFTCQRSAGQALRAALHSAKSTAPRPIRTATASSTICRQQQRRLPLRSFHTCAPQQRKKRRDDLDLDPQPQGASFSSLDVLGGVPPPSPSVDVCMSNGFGLNSGVTIDDGSGALLINGEAFKWRPWEAKGELKLINEKGQFDIPGETLSMIDLLWPRPDLLIIGVGKSIAPLSPETKKAIAEMGLRVDVLDTRNAASQFNMLATERGVADVAAALIPMGWKDGEGAK